jgi:hypothetical protein
LAVEDRIDVWKIIWDLDPSISPSSATSFNRGCNLRSVFGIDPRVDVANFLTETIEVPGGGYGECVRRSSLVETTIDELLNVGRRHEELRSRSSGDA